MKEKNENREGLGEFGVGRERGEMKRWWAGCGLLEFVDRFGLRFGDFGSGFWEFMMVGLGVFFQWSLVGFTGGFWLSILAGFP